MFKDKSTEIYEQWKRGYDYQTKKGLPTTEQKCVDFYYGNQWNKGNKNTKTIPKPVFNMIKLQVNSKMANITSTEVSLRFITNNDKQSTQFFTNFGNYVMKEMRLKEKVNRCVQDSLIKGTGLIHLYYNDKKIGTYGDFEGGVDCEPLDLKNVVFSNPSNPDIQSQEWIIIRSRKSVKSLKSQMLNEEDKLRLKPDTQEDGRQVDEINDNDLCTTYLKYYRKDGEVYHSLSTADVMVWEGKAENPKLHNVEVKVTGTTEDDTDGEILGLPDNELTKNDTNTYQQVKFNRYPIEILCLTPSDDSIYGVSEVYENINTQIFINQLYSMQLLNVMNSAWDKYIVKPNALGKQIINGEPGQVLTDYSNTGDGIKRLGGMNALSNGSTDLADKAYNLARSVSQVNDVFTGQTDNKDLSGVAISQLQAQNDKPIDAMRERLMQFYAEIGKTLVLFMKLYYSEQEFYYEKTDAELIAEGNDISSQTGTSFNDSKYQAELYQSDMFMNTKFHVTVEAVQGIKDSEVLIMSLMQNLLLNGSWQNMDIHMRKLFIEMYPMPQSSKDKFMALVKQQENDQLSQMQQQMQQLAQQNQQLQSTLQRANSAIQYVGNANKSLQSQLKGEYTAHEQDNTKKNKAIMDLVEKQNEGSTVDATEVASQ